MRNVGWLVPPVFSTLLALAGACSNVSDPRDDAAAGTWSPWAGEDESAGSGADESESGGSDGDDGVWELPDGDASTGEPSLRFDVGSWSDIPPIDHGCTKVDFLFVIDNSGSMATHQANLIQNYPAFIDGIQSTLETVDDYHVGVITTDEYTHATPECTGELSGLVSRTHAGDCGPFAEAGNYMSAADDLAQVFGCAADVGVDGSPAELPMAATLAAVEGEAAGPGECNEGFLRDDSLLVIVLLTDEADGMSPYQDPEGINYPSHTSAGTPATWFDDLVAARGGVESNIVVISFLNYEGGPCEPLNAYQDGENLEQLTELFTYGFLAGICEPDYGAHFEQAVGVVEQACNTYVTPG